MAMAKPLIVTDNNHYSIDMEKEKIGFKVAFGDKEGWRQAIQYLIDHPEEAREMEERGQALCFHKFDYRKFAENLATELQEVLKMKVRKKVYASS